MRFDPFLTNGLSPCYHLSESTSVLGSLCVFFIIQFFNYIPLSKRNCPGFCVDGASNIMPICLNGPMYLKLSFWV